MVLEKMLKFIIHTQVPSPSLMGKNQKRMLSVEKIVTSAYCKVLAPSPEASGKGIKRKHQSI